MTHVTLGPCVAMIVPTGRIGQVVMLHVVQEIRLVHVNVVRIVAVLYQLNSSHVTQIPYVLTIVTIVKTGLNGQIAVLHAALEREKELSNVAMQVVRITQKARLVIPVFYVQMTVPIVKTGLNGQIAV